MKNDKYLKVERRGQLTHVPSLSQQQGLASNKVYLPH